MVMSSAPPPSSISVGGPVMSGISGSNPDMAGGRLIVIFHISVAPPMAGGAGGGPPPPPPPPSSSGLGGPVLPIMTAIEPLPPARAEAQRQSTSSSASPSQPMVSSGPSLSPPIIFTSRFVQRGVAGDIVDPTGRQQFHGAEGPVSDKERQTLEQTHRDQAARQSEPTRNFLEHPDVTKMNDAAARQVAQELHELAQGLRESNPNLSVRGLLDSQLSPSMRLTLLASFFAEELQNPAMQKEALTKIVTLNNILGELGTLISQNVVSSANQTSVAANQVALGVSFSTPEAAAQFEDLCCQFGAVFGRAGAPADVAVPKGTLLVQLMASLGMGRAFGGAEAALLSALEMSLVAALAGRVVTSEDYFVAGAKVKVAGVDQPKAKMWFQGEADEVHEKKPVTDDPQKKVNPVGTGLNNNSQQMLPQQEWDPVVISIPRDQVVPLKREDKFRDLRTYVYLAIAAVTVCSLLIYVVLM